jgi:hypothetical protein
MTYTVGLIQRANDDDGPMQESCEAAGCRERGRPYEVWMRPERHLPLDPPEIREVRLCGRHAAAVRALAVGGGKLEFCGHRVLV